jgi:hypothetical protein
MPRDPFTCIGIRDIALGSMYRQTNRYVYIGMCATFLGILDTALGYMSLPTDL